MPIARELRKHYRGPKWRKLRAEILERAQHCCERCGKPDKLELLATASAWFDSVSKRWIRAGDRPVDLRPPIERGVVSSRGCAEAAYKTAQLGIAHLNHVSDDNRPRNLAAWCQECHLLFDQPKHAQTRAEHKDMKRPLLTAVSLQEQSECTTPLSPTKHPST